MTTEQIQQWSTEPQNRKLFRPYNAKPNSVQLQQIFEIASIVDPAGNHKQSSCGRCLYRALGALWLYFNKFE